MNFIETSPGIYDVQFTNDGIDTTYHLNGDIEVTESYADRPVPEEVMDKLRKLREMYDESQQRNDPSV
jgi:hypothetical protein